MTPMTQPQPEAPERPRHRFTVEEYERMVEAGVLGGYRVELIGGEVVEVSAMNAAHARALHYLDDELRDRLPRAAFALRVQTPLRLPPGDMPESDVMVLAYQADRYAGRIPGPGDVRLVIEVSDTTYRYDRGRKLGIYARGGVPEVWIADLAGAGNDGIEGVERHSDPDPDEGAYRTTVRFNREEDVVSATIAGLASPADGIVGPQELRVRDRS